MITANEARHITDTSGAQVAIAMKLADALVRRVAPDKCSAFLTVDGLYDMRPVHSRSIPTQLQAAVMAELKSLGYEVAFGPNPTSVPAPLQSRSLDHTSPLYIDYGIMIKW